MTLGEYITLLKRVQILDLSKSAPEKIYKIGLAFPHSWRGIYAELSFAPTENITVGQMLFWANRQGFGWFHGYKGGEFYMRAETPIHIDEPGECTFGNTARLICKQLDPTIESVDLELGLSIEFARERAKAKFFTEKAIYLMLGIERMQ
jgi:hypothetical protein